MKIRTITAPNPGAYTLDGTRTYVLDELAVVDPGPAVPSHVDAILAMASGLRFILVTHRHPDHAPAAEPLRERTGARVLGPAGITPAPDHLLRDGEMLELGSVTLEAIATPGHTAEHFCFLSPAGDLFTGDTVLGEGTTTIFPPDGDMGAYIDSLRKLREREPVRIFPGHGPMRENASSLIDTYIEHRLARERQILEQLASAPATVRELRLRIYPGLDPALETAAELQITAHLTKLHNESRVTVLENVWRA